MTGNYLFANNATSRLRIDIPAGSPTITLAAGDGAQFPLPTGDDFFMVTLDDRRTGQIEICKCTSRSGDILTVERGQEDTVAQDFKLGSLVSNRITAGTLNAFLEAALGLGGYTKEEADERFVNLDGDTMTGPLGLPNASPTDPNHATRKKYVDDLIAGRAPLSHTHPISQVINLASELANRPTEAPSDGKPYARMSLGWVDISPLATPPWTSIIGKPTTFPPSPHTHEISEVTNLSAELAQRPTEAPMDGKTYGRFNGTWKAAAGAAQVSDMPPPTADDNTFWWDSDSGPLYIRYNDGNSVQWVQVGGTTVADAVPEAPNDGKLYGRKELAWEEVVAEVEEAPIDGNQYARQDGAWVEIEGGSQVLVADAPPVDAEPNSLWWEADTGNLFIFYDDGTDAPQWVQVAPGSGGGSAGGNFLPITGGTLDDGPDTDLFIKSQFYSKLEIQADNDTTIHFNKKNYFGRSDLRSMVDGKVRWILALGDGNYESGVNNEGNDFALWSYKDDGTSLEQVLRIPRSTGVLRLAKPALLAADVGWLTPTLKNGWTNYGAGYGPIGYRKLANGMVIMRGLAAGGTGVIFTLPAGFRPDASQSLLFTSFANPNVACRIDVGPSGDVTVNSYMTGGGNAWVSLAPVTFLAEA